MKKSEQLESSVLSLVELPGDKIPAVAIMGGGGKTSMLIWLAETALPYYNRVLATSTTNTRYPGRIKAVPLMDLPDSSIAGFFQPDEPLFLAGESLPEGKWGGIPVPLVERIYPLADCLFFENDGSRSMPLKQHNEVDPAVPDFATNVLIIVGADIIGERVDSGMVHRDDLFCQNWECDGSTICTVDFVTRVVTSDKGYLKKVPRLIPVSYFVNKWDEYPREARLLAESIRERTGSIVGYGSNHNRKLRICE